MLVLLADVLRSGCLLRELVNHSHDVDRDFDLTHPTWARVDKLYGAGQGT